MKVWVFLESVKPLRWGIRHGNKWNVVKNIDIRIPMQTKHSKIPPQGYLTGYGKVFLKKNHAKIIAISGEQR